MSTREQNEVRQLVALNGLNIPEKNIYMDKQSGKDFERPQYRKLMRRMKKDDLLYGQNEMAGAVTLNLNAHNINGSAGFPTIGSRIIVVDPDTLEKRGINETGLILEQCNSYRKNRPRRGF